MSQGVKIELDYLQSLISSAVAEHGTIKAVAEQLGVHVNSVYSWKKGRGLPRAPALIWLLQYKK